MMVRQLCIVLLGADQKIMTWALSTALKFFLPLVQMENTPLALNQKNLKECLLLMLLDGLLRHYKITIHYYLRRPLNILIHIVGVAETVLFLELPSNGSV